MAILLPANLGFDFPGRAITNLFQDLLIFNKRYPGCAITNLFQDLLIFNKH
jgi:hypothetical protein